MYVFVIFSLIIIHIFLTLPSARSLFPSGSVVTTVTETRPLLSYSAETTTSTVVPSRNHDQYSHTQKKQRPVQSYPAATTTSTVVPSRKHDQYSRTQQKPRPVQSYPAETTTSTVVPSEKQDQKSAAAVRVSPCEVTDLS